MLPSLGKHRQPATRKRFLFYIEKRAIGLVSGAKIALLGSNYEGNQSLRFFTLSAGPFCIAEQREYKIPTMSQKRKIIRD
jgi:hypothetical protein